MDDTFIKINNVISYQPDTDRDGYGDGCDNCKTIPNGLAQASIPNVGNQLDTDNDGIGNACEGQDQGSGAAELVQTPVEGYRHVGDKNYELSNHLGNVLSVITDRKLFVKNPTNSFTFMPDVLSYNDYYPFGSLIPNRHGASTAYRYGFNGMEKDDQINGEGNSINYIARMQDTRVGRFLSIDPLSKKFPMLTPYQFASNNPILNVDLDGMEGVSYRLLKKDETTGKLIPIKRVIEIDIYMAVESNEKNGGYLPTWANSIKGIIKNKFNTNSYLDSEGLSVEFKFNFIDFDPKTISPQSKVSQTNQTVMKTNFTNKYSSSVDANGKALFDNFETYTGLTMYQSKLSGRTNGETIYTDIKIDPTKRDGVLYPFGYAECHEITHFLLSANGITNEAPLSFDHHILNGWMQYAKKIISGEEDNPITKIEKPNFQLTKEIFDKIINSVPTIDDKVEK